MRILGLRVTRAVGQRLLHNAINTRPLEIADGIELAFEVNRHRYAGVLGKLSRLPAQRRSKSGIIEHGSTQTHRDIAYGTQCVLHEALRFLEVVFEFLRGSGA